MAHALKMKIIEGSCVDFSLCCIIKKLVDSLEQNAEFQFSLRPDEVQLLVG